MNNYTINDSNISNALQVLNNFVFLDDETKQTINARDLHKFLENKYDFTHWIKYRIKQYSFQEGVDFIRAEFSQNFTKTPSGAAYDDFSQNSGGRPKLEYHITLDMAKQLAMVENNEKGQIARRYFIECEKRLKLQNIDERINELHKHFHLPKNYGEALAELSRIESERSQLALENKELKTTITQVSAQKQTYTFTQTAKVLGISRKALINYLLDNKWLYRQDKKLTPYRTKIENGTLIFKLFHTEKDLYNNDYKTPTYIDHTYVTPKGVVSLSQAINKCYPNFQLDFGGDE